MQEKSAVITPESLESLKALIGTEIVKKPAAHLTEATRDAIRHWAEAIGDRNRIWTDEAYALSTSWQRLMAPPTMLSAFDKLSVGYRGGLPGVHSFFGGVDWKWQRPTFLGDTIRGKIVFKDLIEKTSRFSRRMFQQVSAVTFIDGKGDVICDGESWGLRVERGKPKEKGKYNRLELKTYTKEDLEEVTRGYDREVIRGGTPQYWDDIAIGDELPPVLKGPYTPTHAIAYEIARGGSYMKSHGFWYDYLKRHPAIGVLNELGIPESPERIHWDSEFARHVGVPAAFDYGPERIAWLGHLMTNWIGNDGFLKRLRVLFKRFNLMGDLTWCKGKVTRKEQIDGQFLVHCDIWCDDQRGECTAEGEATVALPTRSGWLPASSYGT